VKSRVFTMIVSPLPSHRPADTGNILVLVLYLQAPDR